MRAVLDTNVVASALLWGGTPERLIEAAPIAEPALRDPDDAAVLACAVAARADAIVSGDKDLRALGSYGSIRIVTPAEALRLVSPAG